MSSSYLVFRGTVRSLQEEAEILDSLLACGYSTEAVESAQAQLQAEDALLLSVLAYEQGTMADASADMVALALERAQGRLTGAMTIQPRSA